MLKEVFVHVFVKESICQLVIDSIKELNDQQDILLFCIVGKDCSDDSEQLQMSDFCRDITLKIKNNNQLPNLITVTDKKILTVNSSDSIGCYFTNSRQIGFVTMKEESSSIMLKYELLRTAIQLAVKKYLEHRDEGCFFDQNTSIYNTKLCSHCHEQLSSELSGSHFLKLTRVLKELKDEKLGIGKSNLFSVIIMDIVAYSMQTDTVQKKLIEKLQGIILKTEIIAHNLENIIFLPTGDGCVIALHQSLHSILIQLCAELQKKVSEINLEVRFGLNFGSVFQYKDVNNNVNIAGSGINMAARAMDAGDANHIIANRTIYDQLGNMDDWHRNIFHELGTIEVKHGVKLDIYNIYSVEENFGNPQTPAKMRKKNEQQ